MSSGESVLSLGTRISKPKLLSTNHFSNSLVNISHDPDHGIKAFIMGQSLHINKFSLIQIYLRKLCTHI